MKIGLVSKYIRPTMGFHRVVEMLPQIISADKYAKLVIAGAFYKNKFPDYAKDFLELLQKSKCKKSINFINRSLPAKEYHELISSLDLVVFPSEAGDYSSSIIEVLMLGKPVIASDLVLYKKIIQRTGAGIIVKSTEELIINLKLFLANCSGVLPVPECQPDASIHPPAADTRQPAGVSRGRKMPEKLQQTIDSVTG